MRKGQLEFAAIAAVVIIGAILIVFSFNKNIITPPISSVNDEQRLIKDSITSIINSGLKESIDRLYADGGSSNNNRIKYGMKDLALWQACNNVADIDIEGSISRNLKEYIDDVIKSEMDFYGKNVTFDKSKMKIKINIKKGFVEAVVHIPTIFSGTVIPQPYIARVDSDLYNIIDFAHAFSHALAKTRYFEVITINSMLFSNPYSEYWLPVAGELVGCGKFIKKSREDMIKAMKGIIQYTVTHAVYGKKPIFVNGNPFYPFTEILGRKYDLDVVFQYPHEWNLNSHFMSSENPLYIQARPVMDYSPYCITPYSVQYSFDYPVIVMAHDDKINKWFRFAVMVDVDKNKPGNCSNYMISQADEYEKECIDNARCKIKINVTDEQNNPVSGADGTFYICDIGRSDEDGIIEANVPCITSELTISKDEFITYDEILSSKNSRTINVKLKPVLKRLDVKLYGVEMHAGNKIEDGVYDAYTPIRIRPIDDFLSSEFDVTGSAKKSLMAFITFKPEYSGLIGEEVPISISNVEEEITSSVTLDFAYPANFNVYGMVFDNESKKVVGYINYTFEIKSGDKELYIYMPVVTTDGNDEYADSLKSQEADKLMEQIINCGIEPVSRKEEVLSC